MSLRKTSSSNIYCGAKKVPKKKRYGSMTECIDKKKVCLYGLKKIDSRLIQTIDKQKESKKKLYGKYGKLMGLRTRLSKQIDSEKDKDKLKEYKYKLNEIDDDIEALRTKLQKNNSRK